MARKPIIRRKETAAQPPMDATVTPAAGMPVPGVLEYRPLDSSGKWRVERFEQLAAEFLDAGKPWEDQMAQFGFFCAKHPRLWLLVRRFYGVSPLIPPADATPDDLRVWGRRELEDGGHEVSADVSILRQLWLDHQKRESLNEPPAVGCEPKQPLGCRVGAPGLHPQPELQLDDKVLDEFQFPDRLFAIKVWDPVADDGRGADVMRKPAENEVERTWFIGRVKEWAKMLRDPIGGPVARSALMNDLYLRRLESEIATATAKARSALYEQKTQLSQEYNEAVERLQEMFPEMAVAGRVSFRAVVSDLIVAHRDYYANADRRLVDKVFTAAEVEFQLRTSQQVEARYRMSLNLAIVASVNGFLDPEFRLHFKPTVLKKLDAAVKAAMDAVREASGEHVVDLEDGVMPGEGDEFEDYGKGQEGQEGRMGRNAI